MSEDEVMEETERWLIRRGLPHLISDYNIAEDVFTRALPVLTFVFVASVFGAVNLDWTWERNLAAVVGGAMLLSALYAGVNRLRGRPHFAQPDNIGPAELATFVFLPPILNLAFGGQMAAALGEAVSAIVFLVGVWIVVSFGLIPMTRWAVGQMFSEVRAVIGLVARALPLLLLVLAFLFINAEVWQVGAELTGPFLALTSAMFIGLGIAFLLVRLPQEIESVTDLGNRANIAELTKDTPVAPLARRAADDDDDTFSLPDSLGMRATEAGTIQAKLSRRERFNVVLVSLFSELVQVFLVSVMVAGFFFIFGIFAINETVIEAWTQAPADVIFDVRLWGRDMVISAELLQVTAFLAAFSALYFSVYEVTDETFRREFFEDVLDDVRQALAVRVVYAEAYHRRSVAESISEN